MSFTEYTSLMARYSKEDDYVELVHKLGEPEEDVVVRIPASAVVKMLSVIPYSSLSRACE